MKRKRNREDPSEHDTTDDEGINKKVIIKVKQHYRNKDCIVVFRDHIIRKGQDLENLRSG